MALQNKYIGISNFLNGRSLNMAAALFAIAVMPLNAQETAVPLDENGVPKPTQYISIEEQKPHLVFFQGFTLSADLYGPVSYLISDYGTFEGALRLNLKNTYLPIFELGYGKCKTKDENTKIEYSTEAPYMRIGVDFNLLKDKYQDNRLYFGARYGLSNFKYNISGPEMTDPIWGGSGAFSVDNISCTSHWAEVVFGAEVKMWKNFHMGWLVRYKMEMKSSHSDNSRPSCIPGYGYTTNSTCWGGTYSLIFDLNWGKKKNKKKGYNINIHEIEQVGSNNEEPAVEESEETK